MNLKNQRMKCTILSCVLNAIKRGEKVLPAGSVLIAMFIVVMIATSCSRWCQKHSTPSVVIVDSSRTVTETKYRDTIVYVQIPGKIRVDSIPVVIQVAGTPALITPNRLHSELAYCEAEAWIKSNKLFLELSQKDTIIATKIQNAIKSVVTSERYYRNEVLRLTVENKEKQALELKKGRKQGFICALVLLAVLVGGYFAIKKKLL